MTMTTRGRARVETRPAAAARPLLASACPGSGRVAGEEKCASQPEPPRRTPVADAAPRAPPPAQVPAAMDMLFALRSIGVAPSELTRKTEAQLQLLRAKVVRHPPLHERLAAFYYSWSFGLGFYCWGLALWATLRWPLLLAPLLVAYMAYACTAGARAACEGSWPAPLKRWALWQACAAYFPARLHATAALPPEQGPYIFCYHPHGILTFGVRAAAAWGAVGPAARSQRLVTPPRVRPPAHPPARCRRGGCRSPPRRSASLTSSRGWTSASSRSTSTLGAGAGGEGGGGAGWTAARGRARLLGAPTPSCHTHTPSRRRRTPVLREYLLLHGACSVAKQACLSLLARGKSIMIAVGGGTEVRRAGRLHLEPPRLGALAHCCPRPHSHCTHARAATSSCCSADAALSRWRCSRGRRWCLPTRLGRPTPFARVGGRVGECGWVGGWASVGARANRAQ